MMGDKNTEKYGNNNRDVGIGPYFTLLSANFIKTTPTPAIHSL